MAKLIGTTSRENLEQAMIEAHKQVPEGKVLMVLCKDTGEAVICPCRQCQERMFLFNVPVAGEPDTVN